MTPTEVRIPFDLFKFAGQSVIDLWNIHERIKTDGPPSYERWLSNEIVLAMYQIKTLADGGYTSNDILQLVRDSGVIPFHGIRKDAVLHIKPETAYQKIVNFALHWVNRFKEIYGERNLVETSFWMINASFGYRITSRSDIGRKNEVQAKMCAHNIRMLAMLSYMMAG